MISHLVHAPCSRVPQPYSHLLGPLLGVAGVSTWSGPCWPGSLGCSPSLHFPLPRPPSAPSSLGVRLCHLRCLPCSSCPHLDTSCRVLVPHRAALVKLRGRPSHFWIEQLIFLSMESIEKLLFKKKTHLRKRLILTVNHLFIILLFTVKAAVHYKK